MHGYDPDTPLEETLAALDHAVASGRVRYVGVSNFAGWQTARAADLAGRLARAGPRSSPPRWSTRCWSAASSARCCPPARRSGLGVLPWSPLGRGVLTGKYRARPPGRLAGRLAALRARSSPTYLEPRCSSIVEAVATAAGGLGVSPLEVALAWVRDRPGVAAPILGARTVGQLLGALQVERDRPCRRRSPRALDDVSAVPVGYPERDG